MPEVVPNNLPDYTLPNNGVIRSSLTRLYWKIAIKDTLEPLEVSGAPANPMDDYFNEKFGTA